MNHWLNWSKLWIALSCRSWISNIFTTNDDLEAIEIKYLWPDEVFDDFVHSTMVGWLTFWMDTSKHQATIGQWYLPIIQSTIFLYSKLNDEFSIFSYLFMLLIFQSAISELSAWKIWDIDDTNMSATYFVRPFTVFLFILFSVSKRN